MINIFSSQSPVRTSDFYEKGTFSIVGESIPSGETVFTIATLSRTNFAHGHIDLAVPHWVSNVRQRGIGGYIEITRSIDDSWGELDEYSVTAIASYPSGHEYSVWEYWQRFRDYSTGFLSSAQYSSAGAAARIRGAVIDGNLLKITILNTHASINATINLQGTYRVEGFA